MDDEPFIEQTRSPFTVWREGFIEDRCVDEKMLWREVVIASLPYFTLILIVILYICLGSLIICELDSTVDALPMYKVYMFLFNTLSTVGYGNVVPSNTASKVFIMAYVVVGTPLLYLTLANFGHLLEEGYEVLVKSRGKTMHSVSDDRYQMPLYVVIGLLLMLSFIGGIFFHHFFDGMSLAASFYFSFISVTTIGYGDFLPSPESHTESVMFILYLSVGIVFMSNLLDTLSSCLDWIHNIGRSVRGTQFVRVWFGGKALNVKELVELVSDHFEVSPDHLRKVLHDLDSILEIAMDYKQLQKKSRIDLREIAEKGRSRRSNGKYRGNGHVEAGRSAPQPAPSPCPTEHAVVALRVVYDRLHSQGLTRTHSASELVSLSTLQPPRPKSPDSQSAKLPYATKCR